MSRLRLFLDAESQLAQEAQQDVGPELGEAFLQQEGLDARQAHQRLAQEASLRQRLVQLWVDQTGPSLGARWLGFHHGLSTGLAAIGFLLGLLACQAALWTQPGQVIDLWRALALLVALPLLTTLFTLGLMVFARFGSGRWRGFGQSLLQLWSRKATAKHLPAEAQQDFFAHSLPVEQSLWLRQSQLFAWSLQLGMVLCFATRLWFSELQFGWSTTTEHGHETFLAFVVELCSAPWAWLIAPEHLPSAEVIRNTRWDPLASSFASAEGDGRLWWPFLFGSLLFWGLLPRTLLWLYANLQVGKVVRALTWSHRGYQDLFQRALPLAAKAASGEHLPLESIPTATAGEARRMLLWGSWAEAIEPGLRLTDAPPVRLGLSAGSLLHAGAALADDTEALRSLQANPPSALWLLVEAGESPDKRFLRFLGDLREQLDSKLELHVWPLEFAQNGWQAASSRDLEVWSRTLAARHDRYLHLHREASA